MNRDTLIFAAFCVFVLLVGIRLKQRISDRKKQKEKIFGRENLITETEYREEVSEIETRKLRRENKKRLLAIVQFFILGGLLIYMILIFCRDFRSLGSLGGMNIVLRCLIFIFTIYIFILGYFKVFKRKDKENTGE